LAVVWRDLGEQFRQIVHHDVDGTNDEFPPAHQQLHLTSLFQPHLPGEGAGDSQGQTVSPLLNPSFHEVTSCSYNEDTCVVRVVKGCSMTIHPYSHFGRGMKMVTTMVRTRLTPFVVPGYDVDRKSSEGFSQHDQDGKST